MPVQPASVLAPVEDVFIKGHDWSVAVHGVDAAGLEIIENDLGDFYPIVAQPVGQLIGDVRVNIESQDEIDRLLDRLRRLPYREIVLHYPVHRVEGRKFGRLSRVENREVVHSTKTGSIFHIDADSRSVVITNANAAEAASEVRRIFRDELLIPWSEQNGHTVFHGAAFSMASGTSLVVGPSGAGKTTFFLAALEVGAAGLCCERVLVKACDGTAYAAASPERMNLHPGSLRRHTGLRHLLPPDVDVEHEWTRAAKTLIPWKQIFAPFGAVPPAEPQPVSRLVFPQFGQSFSVEQIGADEARRLLEAEVLSGADPLKMCNWLAWYHYDDSFADEVLSTLAALPSVKVMFSDVSDVMDFLRSSS